MPAYAMRIIDCSSDVCSSDLGRLLPQAKFPDQIEIQAGRYFVRPRYEIVQADGDAAHGGQAGRRRIAHANVERTDLTPTPDLPQLGDLIGKGRWEAGGEGKECGNKGSTRWWAEQQKKK